MKIGPFDYNVYANSQINSMKDINQVPLKTVGQSSVLIADIGKAQDASQIQVNKVRVNGQASVYLPVLKQGGDANTICCGQWHQPCQVQTAGRAQATDYPGGL